MRARARPSSPSRRGGTHTSTATSATAGSIPRCTSCSEPRFVPGLELAARFYEEVVAPFAADVAALGRAARLRLRCARLRHRALDRPRLGAAAAALRRPREDVAACDARWRTAAGRVPRLAGPLRLGRRTGDAPRRGRRRSASGSRRGSASTRAAASRRRDWLGPPQQLLLEVTAGAVFHDGLGELEPRARALALVPRRRLALAARVPVAADRPGGAVRRPRRRGRRRPRLARARRAARPRPDAAGFLLERRYAPYAKWLGTAFARLDAADGARAGARARRSPRRTSRRARRRSSPRVEALARAAQRARHHGRRSTRPCGSSTPARSACSARAASSTRAWSGSGPVAASLPLVGGIDQFADSTDVLSDPGTARRVAGMYGA